jgi:hypothetical protein
MSPEVISTSYLLAVLLGQTPKAANDNGLPLTPLGFLLSARQRRLLRAPFGGLEHDGHVEAERDGDPLQRREGDILASFDAGHVLNGHFEILGQSFLGDLFLTS